MLTEKKNKTFIQRRIQNNICNSFKELQRPGDKLEIKLNPVGIVHTGASDDEIRKHTKGIESKIEVYSQFEEALDGLEGFSHIFVIGYFHNLRLEQVGPLRVKPRSLLHSGLNLEDLPLLGVFALDSPTRPNPIGLSLVRLKKKEGRNLTVSDLGYFDGTPVLDLKPYQSSYRADKFSLPDWHRRLLEKAGHV
jgi:tRNA-Thr(GGU) m(6)t(6)A37 methyltransferase TsaA